MSDRHIVTDAQILSKWSENPSVKCISKDLDISYNKVLKALSSNGIVINETHQKIMQYYEQGMSAKEISGVMRMNTNVVQSYLPRVRPAYNVNQSKNAQKIMRWRESKK